MTKPPPIRDLSYKPDEIHATIERDTDYWFGWTVKVWTSPITYYRSWTFTHAGARRSARRGVARERRRLARDRQQETIR